MMFIDRHKLERLVRLAVRGCAKIPQRRAQPAWHQVAELMAIGSASAREICEWAEVDPDKEGPVIDPKDEHGNCRFCGNEIEEETDERT